MKVCIPEGVLPADYLQALGVSTADFYLGVLQALGPARKFEALEITGRFVRDFLMNQLSSLPGDSPNASSSTHAASTPT